MYYRGYRAPRSRKPARTNEQSRRLNVDVRKIPEWEAELAKITSSLAAKHPLDHIARAWRTIVEALPENENEIAKYKREIDDWLRSAKPDSLYSFSDFGVLKSHVFRDGLEQTVKTRLRRAESFLEEAQAKGTSNSGWSQLFLGKYDPSAVAETRREMQLLKTILPKLPEVARANAYLDAVRASYKQATSDADKVQRKLWLAYEKRQALEEFEQKTGKALAKAAGVDKSTRQRADSLKRIVSRTKDCPYCSGALGNDAHLDHIYPVHMGGLSAIENLVWCCAECNRKKRGKGLLMFLREASFPVDQIIDRLHRMGKHV
jgi:hypothetical protein